MNLARIIFSGWTGNCLNAIEELEPVLIPTDEIIRH
jgi:hypothetical protein